MQQESDPKKKRYTVLDNIRGITLLIMEPGIWCISMAWDGIGIRGQEPIYGSKASAGRFFCYPGFAGHLEGNG